MATREQIFEGIRRADSVGDAASVRRLGEYLKSMSADQPVAPEPVEDRPGAFASFGAGAGAEIGKIVLTGQGLLGKGVKAVDSLLGNSPADKSNTFIGDTGDWLVKDAEQGRRNLTEQNAPFAEANPWSNGAGKFAADAVVTAPVGGLLAKGAKALAPGIAATKVGTNLLQAVSTSGMNGGNLATRSVGAAITGAASAGVVDPESVGMGAVIGGLTPGFFRAAGITGEALSSLVRPFFAAGQGKIVADVLRRYASDPAKAVQALRGSAPVVPGSMPTTAAAAGDAGLSGLTRTMQSANPDFAAELANRATSQNTARTVMLEGLAGNTGKVAIAKQARDTATGGMRESVLQRAGDIDANSIVKRLDRMLKDPNNAGQTAQSALRRMRDQVAGAAQDGRINARALYEIRKDAGLAMNGKLQGEAGNLRFARGQLDHVQGLFDNAIEAASRQPVSTLPKIGVGGPRLVTQSQGEALQAADQAVKPVTSWRAYLSRYAELSKPINQMEALQDIMQRVQTGATDMQGNLVLSAAKLNNILKNEQGNLAKLLEPEQLQALRNLAADLNASQLSMNSGRAVGSNTVQNLAGDQLLTSLLGRFGGSSPARTTLGNLLRVPYSRANQDIQGLLGNALLHPNEAAALIEQAAPRQNMLSQLPAEVRALPYRVPNLLSVNDR